MEGATVEVGTRLQDLMKAVRLLKQRSAQHSAVPLGSIGMLMRIDRLESGCHSRELAVSTALDPSTVSRAVAALVAQGLVAREPDPHDGRATVLILTPAGRAALDEATQWYGEVLGRALDGWTPGEVASFSAALHRFTTAIEAPSHEPPSHGTPSPGTPSPRTPSHEIPARETPSHKITENAS
ncbi:MarR family winged helix-turn-helix transcriptional regulator [Symbioplanes lichenis]|uniref:MarR family winged helix-turn-helix transcriptional regulator n=1 Tax=Symbioplanes lichenis TaxID=1629072 RepID=UPI00273900B4|nr:MarR family winged helix-turn-helix transcriptional regulator [Actinoplanes lichenis]